MTTQPALLQSIQAEPNGLRLAELLAQHPTLARRTVQRWLGQWVVQKLQRLHEGVLARYGLRPSELVAWKMGQKML